MQNIRPFEVNDLNDILKLDQLCYRQEIQFTQANLLEILKNENTLCYLYKISEKEELKTVGNFIIKIDSIKRSLALITITVHPEYRNKNYGNEQIECIKGLCRYLNLHQIILQTEKENQTAIDFFEKHDFVITAELDDFLIENNLGLEMVLQIEVA